MTVRCWGTPASVDESQCFFLEWGGGAEEDEWMKQRISRWTFANKVSIPQTAAAAATGGGGGGRGGGLIWGICFSFSLIQHKWECLQLEVERLGWRWESDIKNIYTVMFWNRNGWV